MKHNWKLLTFLTLFYSTSMFLIMEVAVNYDTLEEHNLWLGYIKWLIAGIVFGLVMVYVYPWTISKKDANQETGENK